MTTQTDDLFEAGKPPQDTSTDAQGADPFAELVGEGKKFKTPQDLAKSALHKDEFIEQLKRENADMRRELESASKAGAIDEALERLNAKLSQASGTTEATTSSVTRDDIRAMLQEEKQAEREAANLALIQAELLKKHNNDKEAVKAFLAKRSTELGVSPADLKAMVTRTPNVAKTILGLQQPQSYSGPTPPPAASRNTEVGVGEIGTRNKAYYDSLRKQMGTKFWTPAIQTQMFKDRLEQGEAFNN
jgi:hypothetical protein